jgi:predicted permease
MTPPVRGTARGALPSHVLRVIAFLVPRDSRAEWLEEWQAELAALDAAERRSTNGEGDAAGVMSPSDSMSEDDAGSTRGLPGRLAFVAGAVPHALWIRREEWTVNGLLQDVRYAVRVLARSPGFTIVAALTLALGIGANATVFSLVNGLVLRAPSGVVEPDRMVQIARSYEEAPRWDNWSWPAMLEIRRSGAPVFEDVFGHQGRRFIIGEGVEAEPVIGELVTGNYFGTLGVRAALGRVIEPSDHVTPGAHPVAVLGWDLWRRRFGGDPGVIGTTVSLSGSPYQIIGVAPRGFTGIETFRSAPQLFIPAVMHPGAGGMMPFDQWGWSWFELAGRLRDGVSVERAQSAMGVVSARLRAASSDNEDILVLLERGLGLDPQERAESRRISFLLVGIAGLVLLLTCANVANLFIVRSTARAGEMGVRMALGAAGSRIARQLTTESVVLALLAAVIAAPLVIAAAGLLPALLPWSISTSLAPDIRVFAGLVVLGTLAGLIFGAGPAVMVARRNLFGTLREGGSTGGTTRTRGRDLLVVGQIAVSLGLIAAAALLGHSVLNASAADPGFEPRGLLVAQVDPGLTGRYDRESAADLHYRLRDAAAAMPGVDAVALASQAPFYGPFARSSRVPLEQRDNPDASFETEAYFVDGNWFTVMDIPIVRGRALRDAALEPEPVVVVSESLARMFWPGEDPIGRMIVGSGEARRVVGVAGDITNRSLRGAPRPIFYEPLSGAYDLSVIVHLRTTGDPRNLARPFRELVAEMDPGMPVTGTADLHTAMAESLGETKSVGILVATFAVLALVLSTVGLYGLVAWGVSRRFREMGIRMALGADPGGIIRMVMARGLGLAFAGLLIGTGLALALGSVLEGVLYSVPATSPLALVSASLLMLAAAALAAWLPARRAGRVDAASCLRY